MYISINVSVFVCVPIKLHFTTCCSVKKLQTTTTPNENKKMNHEQAE